MSIYNVTLPDGSSNLIEASQAFVEEHFPDQWELVQGDAGAEPDAPPQAPPEPIRLRKVSFFDRFPKAENGVSTKYDLLSFFMGSDEYADSLGVAGEQRIALRLLITTGLNRINASMYVDLEPNADGSPTDAAKFIGLLMMPTIPQAFRLDPADAGAILNPAMRDDERFVP